MGRKKKADYTMVGYSLYQQQRDDISMLCQTNGTNNKTQIVTDLIGQLKNPEIRSRFIQYYQENKQIKSKGSNQTTVIFSLDHETRKIIDGLQEELEEWNASRVMRRLIEFTIKEAITIRL